MRLRTLPLLLLLALSLAVACASPGGRDSSSGAGSDADGGGPAPGDTVRVLFIGNSYTYVNNLPAVLAAMARSATPAREVVWRMVTTGGRTLKGHWEADDAARRAIREGRWDYVVLQEQSLLGATVIDGEPVVSDPARIFWPYARRFAEEARAAGAEPLFYLTWARKNRPEAQAALTHAYMTVARETGARVVPVGLAWKDARRLHPDVELFDEDGSHPSPAGTYLAASVFFATLFGAPSTELGFQFEGHPAPDGVESRETVRLVWLDSAQAAPLRRAAWNAVDRLRAAGGYLPTNGAAVTAEPSLPQPAAAAPVSFDGAWAGELRFYPREWGLSPAGMTLRIERAGNGWTGRLALDFPGAAADTAFGVDSLEVAASRVCFTAPFGQPPQQVQPGTVRYCGVPGAGGALAGTAEHTSPDGNTRIVGRWTAEKR